MPHVKKLSNGHVPAKAVFVVTIDNKSDCKTNPNVDSPSTCKNSVKSVGSYEFLV